MSPQSSPAESKYIVESIAVRQFFKDYGEQLCLRLVNSEKTLGRSTIKERSVNRPALAVTGYFKYFANKRIQLFGAGEMAFFREQSSARRKNVMEAMATKKIPCVVVSRNLAPTPEMIDVLEKYGVPLFRTSLSSKAFTTEVTMLLEGRFAPRSSCHGTLLDIRGIGTLIRGDSGAGKSEAALALIERGHSLVADDIVKVKLMSDHTPVGFCDEISRGYMECRGIGIINVEELLVFDLYGLRKGLIWWLLSWKTRIQLNQIERVWIEKPTTFLVLMFQIWRFLCDLGVIWQDLSRLLRWYKLRDN